MADLKTQLEIGVDGSAVETGVGKVKKSLADLGNAAGAAGEKASEGLAKVGTGADAAAKRIDASTKNLIGSIQRQIAQVESGSRGGSAFFETLAKQRGVPVDALKPFLQQLDEANAKQAQLARNGLGQHFDYATRSVKQTTAALRQVPAQLTDIAVSLQGGQAPLTVLLQQGGQLKDIFGGIGPAARALGSYLLGLVNPFTLAAAAVGTLALAYKQGTEEIDAYAKALILSGNATGTTVSKLNQQAEAISKVTGTQAAAAEALAQFAADGNVAANSMQRFAKVAVQMERTTGQAVSKTVEQFAALGKDPLQASIKLNETTRFLTTSLYQQIKALEDQGRVADAAAAAQNGFASAMESRTAALEQRLGHIERAWKGVKDAAAGAWSAMLNVGRGDPGTKLEQARVDLEALEQAAAAARARGGTPTAAFQARLEQQRQIVGALDETIRLEGRSAAAQADGVKQTKARIDFDAIAKKNLVDKGQLLQKEIDLIKNAGKAAGATQKEINDAIAGARERFKPAAGPRDAQRGIDRSDLQFDLSAIKAEADRLVGIYSDAERVLETLRAGALVKDREYYEARRQLLALESAAKEDAFRQEIARLEQERGFINSRNAKDKQDRQQNEKDAIDNDRAIAKAKADLAILQARTSSRNVVLTLEEANAIEALERSYRSATLSAQDYLDTQNRTQNRFIEGLGKGAQERVRTSGINQIDDNFASQRRELENLKILGKMTDEEYQTRLRIIQEFQRKSIASFDAYYAKLIEMQGDASLGAAEATANYIDEARNVAASTQEFVSHTFSGLEDSLTKFLTTGKGGFKEFANAIVADITRIIVKQQLANALASVMGKTGGDFGVAGDLFNALMGSGGSSIMSSGTFGIGIAGLATGGSVSRGGIYEVNERAGPGELLNVGSRQYLLASQAGQVTPQATPQGRQAPMNFVINVPPSMDRNTASQVATATGRAVQRALARNA